MTDEPLRTDAQSDMLEIVAQLGDPKATYQTRMGPIALRIVLGLSIIAITIVAHYLLWTGNVIGAKNVNVKMIVLMIVLSLAGPGAGISLIRFALRSLRTWVLRFDVGLFVWRRGTVLALPSHEVDEVVFVGLPKRASMVRGLGPDDTVEFWVDLQKAPRRLFGTTMILHRLDGESVSLTSVLSGFPNLAEHAQRMVYRNEMGSLLKSTEGTLVEAFGPLVFVRETGLMAGSQFLPWLDLRSINLSDGHVVIESLGRNKPWARIPTDGIENLHVLVGLIHLVKPTAVGHIGWTTAVDD